MTKADIVARIADQTGIDRLQVQRTVESFLTVMKDSMAEGKSVYFRGFGSFIIKRRARKVARNITKKTEMIIEPHSIPAFKPSKSFMEEIKRSVK